MIVAAICARGGSKGVPRKNLRILAGKPLIAHTVEMAKTCKDFDRVVVSTDDEEMARVAQQYGAEVPFLRPAHLAQDTSSKWDVFHHLVTTLEAQDGVPIDVLVDLDTGTPLRSKVDVEQALAALASSDADIVTTAYAAERNPYFNMVEWDGEYVRLVKGQDRAIVRRQDAPEVFSLSPAVFAIRRSFILKRLHFSAGRVKIIEIPRERAVDIDVEIDFRFVEFLMQSTGRAK